MENTLDQERSKILLSNGINNEDVRDKVTSNAGDIIDKNDEPHYIVDGINSSKDYNKKVSMLSSPTIFQKYLLNKNNKLLVWNYFHCIRI